MRSRKVLALSLLLSACGSSPPVTSVPAPAPVVAEAPPPAAAPVPDEPPLPLDSRIRKTVLKNGLTVYVMPNKKPEKRAQLWLAVNTGSVLEDDDQQGLAHFVEHMAFNGTKHFEKMAIVNFIEKVGMRFGADLNAYTSFDETVYMLTVPTDEQKLVATGLDIIRDWAGEVSFEAAEVEKERGVVMEEWRLGRGAFDRIWDKLRPAVFAGSRYATRSPIGIPEVLKNAPRDTLVRFYKEWYRPENMAVIAVGDFDAEAMEKEIASRFGGLTGQGKARVRAPVPVPHDQPTSVTIVSDPETPFSELEIMDKMDHRREDRKSDYRRMLVEGFYHAMLGARLNELSKDPDAPFTWAGSATQPLTRTADRFSRFATAKAGRTGDTVSLLTREIARVEQHGFSQAELERAIAQHVTRMETGAAEWDKSPSEAIASELTRNFLESEAMPGPRVELELTKELVPGVTLAEINKLATTWGSDRGRVIAMSGPANAKLPTEAEVRALYAAASTAKVEPWKDTAPPPLMTTMPTPGTIKATSTDDKVGATVWTLSNGIRVVVKPTTFQNDDIVIRGYKKGGSSLVPDVVHARFATDAVLSGGVGELDAPTLAKALAGKNARVRLGIQELSENVTISTRNQDLETALQLFHLRVTAPRKDERAFAAWRAQQLDWVANKRLYPEVSFNEDMQAVSTKNHPRRQPATPEMLNKVDLAKAHAVYRARFGNMAGTTLVIVGNVDPAAIKPLVEKYIASLPGTGPGKETWKDPRITYPTGQVTKQFELGSEPKSYVRMSFGGADKWTRENAMDAEILMMLLDIRLREVMREDMGGVYGVFAHVSLSREPAPRREAYIQFGCDPANVDKLSAAVRTVFEEVRTKGASADNLEKINATLRRVRETDMQENYWWAGEIAEAYWYGDDFAKALDLQPMLARVTSDRIKVSAKHFLDEKNAIVGVMKPRP